MTRAPTNEACRKCHEHAFSDDDKRGTPFTASNDVHARGGLRCLTCHLTEHHKIAKGLSESDRVASDLPDVPVSCARSKPPSRLGAPGAARGSHRRDAATPRP